MIKMMPFNFERMGNDCFLIVNECGDFEFVSLSEFDDIMSLEALQNGNLRNKLESSNFIPRKDIGLSIDLAANKYRTKKGFLRDFTSLHMMVVTVRCNQRCTYCQVSSEGEDSYKYDMSVQTAKKIIDCIFKSPSSSIKIEFQGGEPLLNWVTVKASVEYAEFINEKYKKKLEFVLCTNLTVATEEQLQYISEHDVAISTSLDGNKHQHDANRVLRTGGGTYDLFLEKLTLARNLGCENISALMATTKTNINSLNDVVDEYLNLGFGGVFIRSLNPFGFAAEEVDKLGYHSDDFVKSFESCLDYIIQLNMNGVRFKEFYTSLLLRRILTPYPTGFVDLQSPSGAGISGAIYDYNGDVYPADEARMLSRMGDSYFNMGNVYSDKYEEIFFGELIKRIVRESCLEIMPGCGPCIYRPYCGSDPIRNYAENGDLMGHRPTSSLCKINKGIFHVVFRRIRDASEREKDLFWAWATGRDLDEVAI